MSKQGTWTEPDAWELRDSDGYVVAAAGLSADGDTVSVGSQYASEYLTLAQLDEYIEAMTRLRDILRGAVMKRNDNQQRDTDMKCRDMIFEDIRAVANKAVAHGMSRDAFRYLATDVWTWAMEEQEERDSEEQS